MNQYLLCIYMQKNHHQNISKLNLAGWKGFSPRPSGIFCRNTRLNIQKLINIIHHGNIIKDKNHTIISIDEKKIFDKIQHPFMIKKKERKKKNSVN